MVIEINDSKTVQEIQEEFAKKFPFLKLEFFLEPHRLEEVSNGTPCQPGQLLKDIRQKHIHGIITINPGSRTGAIEAEFERRFGLNVQIFRFQMDKWIQTTGTDILTLKEQNEIGRYTAIFYNPDHQFSKE